MKKILLAVLVLIIIPVVSIIVIGRVFFPDNIAETAPGGGAKGLETRYYDADAESVKKVSEEVIGELTTWGGSWKIVDRSGAPAALSIKVEVPVLVFTDDLEITIRPENGKSRVDVRSASRVGKSDFGENARHVRKFLRALDDRLRSRD